jgi:hypothetical protein
VAKGLSWVFDKPCYSGSFVVLILVVKRNGEKFKNRDRDIQWDFIYLFIYLF